MQRMNKKGIEPMTILIIVVLIAALAGGLYACKAKQEDPDEDSEDQSEDVATVSHEEAVPLSTSCTPVLIVTALKRTVTSGNEYVLSEDLRSCNQQINYRLKLKDSQNEQQVGADSIGPDQSRTNSRIVTSTQAFTEYCIEVISPGSMSALSNCSPVQQEGNAATTTTAQAQTFNVFISNNQYSPIRLVVKQRDQVVWTNRDNYAHQLTSSEFNTSAISEGQTLAHTFNNEGVFDYYDSYYPYMRGIVEVRRV